jgi:hypothetical protein
MDIQGAEYNALKGMENILKKDNLKVLMEFWGYGLKKSGSEPKVVLNLLNNFEIITALLFFLLFIKTH